MTAGMKIWDSERLLQKKAAAVEHGRGWAGAQDAQRALCQG